jgi:hypothetical protein
MKKAAIFAPIFLLTSISSAFPAELSKETTSVPAFAGMLAPNAEPTLRLGAYVGALTKEALIDITLLRPWRQDFQPGAMIGVHAIYTAYRFQSIPIELELEAGVAKRFGSAYAGNQWEFDFIPMARWTYFPWNDYVYTNFRLGMLGVSYVTSVSPFEREFDSSHHGNRLLNLLIPEFTFSPSREAPFEAFVRVHHRSGAFGAINGVHGGSNYISTGIRFTAF